MEFFLVSNARQSSLSLATLGYAGLAIIGVYLLTKAFAGKEEDTELEPFEEEDNQAPAGIYNEGNTCFVNSLLQALSSI